MLRPLEINPQVLVYSLLTFCPLAIALDTVQHGQRLQPEWGDKGLFPGSFHSPYPCHPVRRPVREAVLDAHDAAPVRPG